MALSIDLTILLFIQVYLWNLVPMKKVHSIWASLYNTLTQNDVRLSWKEKWTNIQQDQYDVSSIDGSTFKRDNIINGRWSTMKTKETI